MKPGTHVGGEPRPRRKQAGGKPGKVAKSGRWWPMTWWHGHNLSRRTCGQFKAPEQSKVCHLRHGHEGGHDYREYARPARRSRYQIAADRQEYQAYLESQLAQVDEEAGGYLVNEAGERRGLDSRRLWFSGRRGSMRWATDEMRDYEERHGLPMTYGEFREQSRGETEEEARFYGYL
jgi:hypothetical protein